MSTTYNRCITGLFCGFLTLVLALHLLTPDKNFSQVENRYLRGFPALTFESVTSGKFMPDFETYTTDQFPGRDGWVAAKAMLERLSGKRENNGAYFGQYDTLINRVDTPSQDILDQITKYLNALCANVDTHVSLGIIPTAAAVWSARLPAGALTADERTLIDSLYRNTDAMPIGLYEVLDAHRDEEIYYRTDHHWTSLGAYYAYQELSHFLGTACPPLSQYEKTTVSRDFYGTIYSTSGVRWVAPDQIDTYVPEAGITVTSYFTGSPEPGKLYAPAPVPV